MGAWKFRGPDRKGRWREGKNILLRSHMWPLVLLSSTLDSCSRTMRELEVATSVVRGSGLLIYSWDPDSAAGWTGGQGHRVSDTQLGKWMRAVELSVIKECS